MPLEKKRVEKKYKNSSPIPLKSHLITRFALLMLFSVDGCASSTTLSFPHLTSAHAGMAQPAP
jgi:hypothetical protein